MVEWSTFNIFQVRRRRRSLKIYFMAPKRKRDESTLPARQSYTSQYKLEVMEYTKEHGNRAARRQYSVAESSVRDWRKAEATLQTLPPRKRARRDQTAKWPILEENLASWIRAQQDDGRAVSTVPFVLSRVRWPL